MIHLLPASSYWYLFWPYTLAPSPHVSTSIPNIRARDRLLTPAWIAAVMVNIVNLRAFRITQEMSLWVLYTELTEVGRPIPKAGGITPADDVLD